LSEAPLAALHDGVRVAIRLVPRAKDDRLVAIVPTAAGGRAIKAAVAAPPEDGRANEALLRLLAREWDLPRRDVALIAGPASRSKAVKITGDPGALMARLATRIAELPNR
jgi:uncharacterized protein (TIGR00251 family)